MNKLLKNKSGFTLIEVMVAVLISGILLTVIYQIMTSSSRLTQRTSDQIVAANELDRVTESIRALVKTSTAVTICDANSASPDVSKGESVIKCVDNVIYADDIVLASAKSLGVEELQLEFSADTSTNSKGDVKNNVLNINVNPQLATNKAKSRSLVLYMTTIEDKIEETDGNTAIVYKAPKLDE